MEKITLKDAVLEIVNTFARSTNHDELDASWLDKFVRCKNRENHDSKRTISKRRLMPEYLNLKENNLDELIEAGWTEEIDKAITALLQAKPRRTASGVATITVLMKPWPCSGDCVFCPSDIRMPKSYLHNEPACQRAERWNFDPYLQVTSRLSVLEDMGHNIDKIELIILGGTFSDYSQNYQVRFISECFRACNEFAEKHLDLASIEQPRQKDLSEIQNEINNGNLTYNKAWEMVYSEIPEQNESLESLRKHQKQNESASSRIVGLVVETRPDKANVKHLKFLRQLGCTKIQVGIQTLDQKILDECCRGTKVDDIAETLENIRLLGFKSHVHIMANLPDSTPDEDKEIYRRLMSDERFLPDEVKVYPCCLVESAKLTKLYDAGTWKAYTDEELLDIMRSNIYETPPWCRISRMIRDISTTDIIAGNKKPNLRQLVEENLEDTSKIQEMRFREIANDEVLADDLKLSDIEYKTSVTTEHFLQWVTPENKLCGFLRLSLPEKYVIDELKGSAMIREVHVYGKVAQLHKSSQSAQHLGLGSALIDHACELAKGAGYEKIQVISSVGTREYYRSLGFVDGDLYQYKELN